MNADKNLSSYPQRPDNALEIDTLLRHLACITVTYNPDPEQLATQLSLLPRPALKVIVDNASENLTTITTLARESSNTQLLCNERNHGLAAALNQGVYEAHRLNPEIWYVLLLDQDSEPQPGSIEALISGLITLQTGGPRVGAVGPTLQDAETGLTHGFHRQTRWRWTRLYPKSSDTTPVQCSGLNGSGTLMPISLFLELGGLDETLFIDHVDTEWSFRMLAAGYTLWGIPQAVFVHRMGQASIRYWLFGWRLWPSRSPLRHYYLFRNAVWLMQRNYVSRVWKFWASIKITLTFCSHLLLDRLRRQQVQHMWQGFRDGIAPRQNHEDR